MTAAATSAGLDPQARAWLRSVADSGLPALNEMPVPDARATYAQVVGDCGLPAEAVERVVDRTIPGPGGELAVRIYQPRGSGLFPVLVYYHGGGWVIGNLDVVHGPCTVFSNRAHAIVVSVDYRLAPEHPFPAAVEDAWAGFRWVVEHVAELDADVERIAVGGDSAGGTLATVVALMARDADGPRASHQLLLYPATDCLRRTDSFRDNADGYFLTAELMRWFQDHYLRRGADAEDWRASPLRAADLTGAPPAHVITAQFDPLRDEGEAYAARLREAGVHATARCYDGQIHAFAANLAGVMDRGRAAVEDAAGHLRAVLRDGWQPRVWL